MSGRYHMTTLQGPSSSFVELSVEETLGIVMLTNLLVLLPVVPNLHENVSYDANRVVQLLQAYTPSEQHYFDVDLFSQSIHHNNRWLISKLNWEISFSANPNVPIGPYGTWPAVHRRYYILIRKLPLQIDNYSSYQSQFTDQLRINKMDVLNRLLNLKKPARTTSKLKLHSSVNPFTGHVAPSVILHWTASRPLAVSEATQEEHTPTTVQTLPHRSPLPLLTLEPPSAPPQSNPDLSPRQAVLVSSHAWASETAAYCAHLTSTQQHTLQHYANNKVPAHHMRRALVQRFMPNTYGATFDAQLSIRLQQDAAATDAKRKQGANSEEQLRNMNRMDARGLQVERAAVDVCETLAYMHSGGTVCTPSIITTSLLLALGGTTRRVRDLMSARRMALSATSTSTLLNACLQRQAASLVSFVSSVSENAEKVLVVIADNYSTQQYAKAQLEDKPFTHAVNTVSVLLGHINVREDAVTTASTAPLMCPYNVTSIVQILCEDGIILSEEARSLRDEEGLRYQGLRNFRVHPSLNGKSSSYSDTEEKLLQGLLIGECKMDQRPVVLVADTEYLLTINRSIFLHPERMKNVFIVPPIFHIRMHMLENLTNEPIYAVLVVLVYYYSVGLQKEKCIEKLKRVVASVTAGMDAWDRAQAEAQSKSRSSATATATTVTAATVTATTATATTVTATTVTATTVTATTATATTATATTVTATTATATTATATSAIATATVNTTTTGTGEDFVRLAQEQLAAEQEIGVPEIEFELDLNDLDGGDVASLYQQHHAALAQAGANDDCVALKMLPQHEWNPIFTVLHRCLQGGYRFRNVGNKYKDKQMQKINLARCTFLWQVAGQAAAELPLSELFDGGNWASKSVVDFLQNGILKLAIEPFADIILRGSAVNLLERLHHMAQYLSHCERDKVVRSLLTVAAAQLRIRDHHGPLQRGYLKNCTLFNDNHVENFNASIRNYLPHNCLNTFEIINKTAQLTQLRRDFFPKMQSEYGLKSQSSSRHRGEIYHEETRHLRGKHQNAHIGTKKFFTRHIKWLKNNTVLCSQATVPESMHLMSGALKNGSDRMKTVIGPKYDSYLQREILKAQPHHTAHGHVQPPAQHAPSADETQLNRFYKDTLYAYIRHKSIKGCSQFTKGQLVQKILTSNMKVEFLQFVVEKNLRTAKDGANYGRARGAVDDQIEQERVRRETAAATTTVPAAVTATPEAPGNLPALPLRRTRSHHAASAVEPEDEGEEQEEMEATGGSVEEESNYLSEEEGEEEENEGIDEIFMV